MPNKQAACAIVQAAQDALQHAISDYWDESPDEQPGPEQVAAAERLLAVVQGLCRATRAANAIVRLMA